MSKAKPKQLKIYAPGQENPDVVFWQVMGSTLLICFAIMLWATSVMLAPKSSVKEAQAATNADELFALAQTWTGWSGEMFLATEWQEAGVTAAFMYGPRRASEAACDQQIENLTPLQIKTLEEVFAKRSAWLPRLCLIRVHLEGRAPQNVKGLASKVWERFRTEQLMPREMILVVNTFREKPLKPEPEVWGEWVARCMLQAQGKLSEVCLASMGKAATAPGVRVSMLDFLQHGIRALAKKPQGFEERLQEIVMFLGKMGRFGQSKQWRLDYEGLANTDYDMQIAATWTLCRMMTVEDLKVQKVATYGLYHLINRTPSVVGPIIRRWRQACYLSFGGKAPDLEDTEEPVIYETVPGALSPRISWEAFSSPKGFLGQQCKPSRPPVWSCISASQWKGSKTDISEAMRDAFIKTRYLEWFWEQSQGREEIFLELHRQALSRG